MNQIRKVKALSTLAANLKNTLQGKTITGLDVALHLAQLEDRQTELAEFGVIADKIGTNQTVIAILDELLAEETLSNEAHREILLKKHSIEKTVQAHEKQLAGLNEVETSLVRDGVLIQAATEAQRQGCINSRLAGMYVQDKAQAKLQEDGTIECSFPGDNGSQRINRHGKPMTLTDLVETMAVENPTLFKEVEEEERFKDNPWRPGSFSLMRQGEIVKSNPALARELRVEANRPRGKAKSRNPFMAGEAFSLTEQGRLVRENPEAAKRLAAEAGVVLNI